MRNQTLAAAVLAVSAIAGLTITGCNGGTGTVSSSGPLGTSDGAGSARVCLPVTRGAAATFPTQSFSVRSRRTVVIDNVSLIQAKHVTIIASVLVSHGAHAMGFYSEYPPSTDDLRHSPGADWSTRRDAKGATLQSTKPGQQWDLVLGLEPSATNARFAYARIEYHVASSRYSLSTATGGQFVFTPGKCPNS